MVTIYRNILCSSEIKDNNNEVISLPDIIYHLVKCGTDLRLESRNVGIFVTMSKDGSDDIDQLISMQLQLNTKVEIVKKFDLGYAGVGSNNKIHGYLVTGDINGEVVVGFSGYYSNIDIIVAKLLKAAASEYFKQTWDYKILEEKIEKYEKQIEKYRDDINNKKDRDNKDEILQKIRGKKFRGIFREVGIITSYKQLKRAIELMFEQI